ncbi:acetyl-coenzyme A synthetase N-terminal domain-containing protein, partial [Francisella tularensis]|uniref:acetyl-coenzyme A synthetase N-terminal domain-containing protein n=1 Tax=Francisella tularensis TaxID=263 RepID=UPI002381A07E
ENPEQFWDKQANLIHGHKPFTKDYNSSFAPVDIKWFDDGELNVCYNCVDRHLTARANQVAFIWQADNPKKSKKITYREL